MSEAKKYTNINPLPYAKKIESSQNTEYLDNNFSYKYQFGFRNNNFTNHAIIALVEKVSLIKLSCLGIIN